MCAGPVSVVAESAAAELTGESARRGNVLPSKLRWQSRLQHLMSTIAEEQGDQWSPTSFPRRRTVEVERSAPNAETRIRALTAMMDSKSSTLAKGDASLRGSPSGPVKPVVDTDAMMSDLLPKTARISFNRRRKLAVSSGEGELHPMPSCVGCSQSISTPPKPYFSLNANRSEASFLRDLAEAARVEK